MLVTNDEENPRIPIYVTGRIVPQISVAPESLMLGSVTQGEQVSKKILGPRQVAVQDRLRSKAMMKPACSSRPTIKSSERHVVEVIFDAKKDAGDVKIPIRIATDLGDKFPSDADCLRHHLPTVLASHGEGCHRPRRHDAGKPPRPAFPAALLANTVPKPNMARPTRFCLMPRHFLRGRPILRLHSAVTD